MAGPVILSMNALLATLRPGMRVFVPGSSGEPRTFLSALAGAGTDMGGIELVTNFLPGINRLDPALHAAGIRTTAFFGLPGLGPDDRILPLSYREIDDYLRANPVDLAVVQLSPPDAEGNCSFGPCVEFSRTALATAWRTVGLINPRLARHGGGPFVPFAELDSVVHVDQEPLAVPEPAGDDVARAIARHVAALIADGTTLQLGIGKIPGQILRALTDHRNLRIRSGIVMPNLRLLAESGALADAEIVAASAAGDADFYRWVATNPAIRLTDVTETHDVAAIATTPGFTAINSAIEVDLLGQCNAETLGGRVVSGPGGLPQFTAGARQAPKGCSIVALPATDSSGSVSRIVTAMAPGAPVSVPAHGVDFIVTEFGAADLRRKPRAARALEIAGIAAPDFREALTQAARDAG
ncbi:MAG: acetyl-CoA hydrolase/transferase C-terminal domain-containing protein [Candidatus Sphingomonas phytovorans]|nr:acetyl-CoA hydrolase/transferase C-terminal domain-containing protein [Sphingomonas sp.]WEK02208.1 MAG: acetyl-CoA hydrolase/transferase C-terminal domain-containing protein [Sphingomonas sp.]